MQWDRKESRNLEIVDARKRNQILDFQMFDYGLQWELTSFRFHFSKTQKKVKEVKRFPYSYFNKRKELKSRNDSNSYGQDLPLGL